MPEPKTKSFAKSFFEDIKEQPDATRVAKPVATETQTAQAKAESAENQELANYHGEYSKELQKQADELAGTKKDVSVGTHGEKWSELAQEQANAQKGLAKDYSDKTRVGKIMTKREDEKRKAQQFEQNLHKYDKKRASKREHEEVNPAPKMLQRRKSFAKSFFEDID